MSNSADQSIAKELASQQRAISVAEFFEQNRQMLGFGSKARSLVTAVKEGVDNAIDASEDAGILPEVRVTIKETDDGYYALTITDHGPGITKEHVPKVFGKLLYGSRFSSRVQRRGQQGIGISAAVLYGQLTTGKPAEVVSKIEVEEEAEYFKVGIDTDDNEPEIRESKRVEWTEESESGTSITIYLDANFRARSTLHEYIEHTAIVNPHATVELNEPEKNVRFERSVDELPEQPTEIKPHPHGIEFGTLRSLVSMTDSHSISGFLQSEFTRVGQTTADSIISSFLDRVDGRYCRWVVPEEDEEISMDRISSGEPTPHHEVHGEEEKETGGDRTDEKTTLQTHIANNVNRKSPEATNAFASRIVETLRDTGKVSWVTVSETVDGVAEDVEEEYSTTFGDTVREKAVNAAWDVIRTTREKTIVKLVEEATSDRKTEDDVSGFAVTLTSLLDEKSEYKDVFTEEETRNLVDRTSSVSEGKIANPFGSTAVENVFEALWEGMDRTPNDPPLLREVDEEQELAKALHDAMKEVDVMAPPSHCLSPIGEESLVKGMKKVYNADFYSAETRDAGAHSGEPFLVEAGIAYGGELKESGPVELLRFANRVPLVYQQGACCITSVVSGIRWNNYKLSDKGSGLPQGPVAIVVHVASTNVPFTSESKDAVASVDVIEDEIELAVRRAALNLKKHLDKQQTLRERQKKKDTIATLLPEFSKKIAGIASKPQPQVTESLAQIMNNLLVSVNPDSADTSKCVLTASNYDNQSTYSPTVTVHMEAKPSTESLEVFIEESGDGWAATWEPTVDSDEQKSISLNINLDAIRDITVEGLPDEKVTTAFKPSVEA